MMIILMKMIQKLLMRLDLRLGIINRNKVKVIKNKQRNNVCGMASKKTVGLAHFRRREKRNITIFEFLKNNKFLKINFSRF